MEDVNRVRIRAGRRVDEGQQLRVCQRDPVEVAAAHGGEFLYFAMRWVLAVSALALVTPCSGGTITIGGGTTPPICAACTTTSPSVSTSSLHFVMADPIDGDCASGELNVSNGEEWVGKAVVVQRGCLFNALAAAANGYAAAAVVVLNGARTGSPCAHPRPRSPGALCRPATPPSRRL